MSYMSVAKILPARVRNGYNNLLVYSGIKVPGERFLGFTVIFGLGISATIAYLFFVFMQLGVSMSLTALLVIYVIFEGGIYMRLWLRVESRSRAVENVLPDALQIMAMNIRAGLTTERALILAAKPEFGIFEKELRRAGKEIMAGKELREAMTGITTRIRSKMLDNTIKMIVDGINSGGEMASLLEHTASDIQNTRMMEKEVKANVMMYVIFIFFAVGIGAPLIFGISTHLVEVLAEQMGHFEGLSMPSADELQVKGASPFGTFSGFSGIKAVSVSPEFLVMYAFISLMLTSFFGGLIIGVIKDGEEKHGIKYIPLLMGISVAVFIVTRFIAATMFAI